jgi:hypothetical protein
VLRDVLFDHQPKLSFTPSFALKEGAQLCVRDCRFVGPHRGAHQGVIELALVPGPPLAHQQRARFGGELFGCEARLVLLAGGVGLLEPGGALLASERGLAY